MIFGSEISFLQEWGERKQRCFIFIALELKRRKVPMKYVGFFVQPSKQIANFEGNSFLI